MWRSPRREQLLLNTQAVNSVKVQRQLKKMLWKAITSHSSSPQAAGVLQPRRRKEPFVPQTPLPGWV